MYSEHNGDLLRCWEFLNPFSRNLQDNVEESLMWSLIGAVSKTPISRQSRADTGSNRTLPETTEHHRGVITESDGLNESLRVAMNYLGNKM